MIDWNLIIKSLPLLINATIVSLKITAGALLIGSTIGTLIGIGEAKAHKIIRLFITLYVTVIRGTPMVVQISFFYFVLPTVGIIFSSVTTAIIAIGINSSAYVSQIIKSGILSVGKDQAEAAQVLGFTPLQTTYYFVLPQAIRCILPALCNEGITLIKDSSLASIIGVAELYKESRAIINQTYDVLSMFVIVSLIYLILTSVLSLLASFLQKRMDKYA